MAWGTRESRQPLDDLLPREGGESWWHSARFEVVGVAARLGLRPSEFEAWGEDDRAEVLAYYRTMDKIASVENRRQEREMERKSRKHGA